MEQSANLARTESKTRQMAGQLKDFKQSNDPREKLSDSAEKTRNTISPTPFCTIPKPNH